MRSSDRRIGDQAGAATLLVALVLLIAITVVVFAVSEAVITEKRVSANHYRSQKAFEASEAGLAVGLNEFRKGFTSASSGLVSIYGLETYQYSVSAVSGANGKYWLNSIGFSDDLSARREMKVIIKTPPGLGSVPETPVTARSTVDISGNFKITNTEGQSTVWTGSTFSIQGNSAGTYVSHPAIEGATIRSSSKNYRGPDILDSDPNLASLSEEEFARAFLGETTSEYCPDGKRQKVDRDSEVDWSKQPICIEPPSGSFSWTADTQESIGELNKGKSVVVVGDVKLSGGFLDITDPNAAGFNGCGANLCGLLYVEGSVENTGSPIINGAMIVTGSFSKAGTVDINFSTKAVTSIGGDDEDATAIPGTWKDW